MLKIYAFVTVLILSGVCCNPTAPQRLQTIVVNTNTLCRLIINTDTTWVSKNDTLKARVGSEVSIRRVWYVSGGLESMHPQPDITFKVNKDTVIQASVY